MPSSREKEKDPSIQANYFHAMCNEMKVVSISPKKGLEFGKSLVVYLQSHSLAIGKAVVPSPRKSEVNPMKKNGLTESTRVVAGRVFQR
jgi:hypothetical protein